MQEIDNRARRHRIEEIENARIAQATTKDYKKIMRELQQRDRDIRRAQARAEGRRLELEPNEQEQEVLNRQRHDYLSDWSPEQQERFKSEQEKLWSLIPEQFRGRAEHLVRGGY